MKVPLVCCAALAAITIGCATSQPMSPELATEFNAELYCEGDEQCKTMWERATFFVNTNAGYKMQIHSDTVIETYNPSDYSPSLAFRIMREPLGNGRYRIWTKAWCANAFGCSPDANVTVARAKLYMRTGQR